MFVSVIVCTHSLANLQNLLDAVDSLLNQTYKEMEIIVVVDGNQVLCEKVKSVYGAQDNIKIMVTEESLGAFGAANVGVRIARGDIIGLMDDDAVAENRWVETLVDTYEKLDAISVGGKVLPVWVSGKPDHFPEELYWSVGVTEDRFLEDEYVIEVRNTYGVNMSFKREVFEKIGLFNEKLGFAKRGTSHMQGAEPEFALRMKRELGQGVIYNSEAIVYHKIPPWKVKLRTLLKRALYQGYSKALLRSLNITPGALNTEQKYLDDLLSEYIPRRMKRIVSGPGRVAEIKQLSVLIATIFSVGLGFMYGSVMRR